MNWGFMGQGVRDWIKKFNLIIRKQKVFIGQDCSNQTNIAIGVPQGTNLEPVLFLIYLNDIKNTILAK